MNWYHEVNPEWLKARQEFLTASEVAKILPVTAIGRKRTPSQIADSMMGVYANKQALTVDPRSYGAAARGHLLEPYAIEDFNKFMGCKLYHWDDVLIHDGVCAYSPDAMDVDMPEGIVQVGCSMIEPYTICEVKSYNIESHYKKGFAGKMELEERWQIAHAMNVSKSIEQAYLVFYNPNAKESMLIHSYDRQDLASERKIIDETITKYYEFEINMAKSIGLKSNAHRVEYINRTEDSIRAEIELLQTVNPT